MNPTQILLDPRAASQEASKPLPDRIQHLEKMAVMGQLACCAAHDFNNQLATILGFAGLLQNALPRECPELARYTQQIITSCQNASDLTRQLLGLVRQEGVVTERVEIHAVIRDVMQLLHPGLDRRIRMACHCEGWPAWVLGDPCQLQNMLLNLALNARDAMPDGGVLTLSTGLREFEPWEVHLFSPALKPGAYVQLEVQDTGIGMSPELQRRIFEPFFTTKEAGRGTGLGLVSVQETVKAHQGAILVRSEPGQGTCFQVWLPLVGAKSPSVPAPFSFPVTNPEEGILRESPVPSAGSAGAGPACPWEARAVPPA